MSYTVLFVLLSAMLVTCAKGQCDADTCNAVCQSFDLNGTCRGNECDCSLDKNCLDVVCDTACGVFDLKGECDDNDRCFCKAELEMCKSDNWIDCENGCVEHAPPECIFVHAGACLKYGPVLTCGCICYTWLNKFQFISKRQVSSNFYKLTFSQNDIVRNRGSIATN